MSPSSPRSCTSYFLSPISTSASGFVLLCLLRFSCLRRVRLLPLTSLCALPFLWSGGPFSFPSWQSLSFCSSLRSSLFFGGADPFLDHPALLEPSFLSLLSFDSSFIFTLQVQRRRIGEQKHLTLHIPLLNLMYCRHLIYNLEGILFWLRWLHLDVAAFARRGSPCIMGGARTFSGQGFPHGEK